MHIKCISKKAEIWHGKPVQYNWDRDTNIKTAEYDTP